MILSNDLSDLLPYIGRKDYLKLIGDFVSGFDASEIKHGERREIGLGIAVVQVVSKTDDASVDYLEAHRKFYDLHYTLNGTDKIVFRPLGACRKVRQEYDEKGDYILFDEMGEHVLEVPSTFYCLIENKYAHMALYKKEGAVTKLVFKLPAVE
jgi:YhcH/YjgK/YiaL family protein